MTKRHDAMCDRNARRGTRFAALAGLALWVGAPALAQDFDPRDLTGSYESYPSPFATLEPDPSLPAGPDPIPEPPLKAEYLEPWRAARAEAAAATERGEPPFTGYAACLPDGMPAVMAAMFPMEILQTDGRVTVLQEAYNQVRRIYLDEDQVAVEDAEPLFWGHSVGRWEGDTLVIDTVGVKENVRYRDVPHSAEMRITERITRIHPEIVQNDVTVVDPVYLTEPWTWTWMYRDWPEYKIQEYVCEDNRYYQDPETGAARLAVEFEADRQRN